MPPITTVTSGHCTSVPAPTFSASVRWASNLPPRSKTQGDLGLVETSRGAAAERVLDIETGTQWGEGGRTPPYRAQQAIPRHAHRTGEDRDGPG